MMSPDYSAHFLIEFFDDGALIMRVQDKQTLELDDIGQEILRLFIEKKSPETIASVLSQLYGIEPPPILIDVHRVIEHLASIGFTGDLISTSDPRILDSNEQNTPISVSI